MSWIEWGVLIILFLVVIQVITYHDEKLRKDVGNTLGRLLREVEELREQSNREYSALAEQIPSDRKDK